MKYGFCRVYRPVLDDADVRVFESTKLYRDCVRGEFAGVPWLSTRWGRMTDRIPFNPLQAQQVAEAFNAAGVDYLFIGKSGAILLGWPGTTQGVDIFAALELFRQE